jgi:acyl-CoA hydrolase
LYNQKKKTADEAVSLIKSGDNVYTSLAAMEPFTLLSALHKAAENGGTDITVTTATEMSAYPFSRDSRYAGRIRHASVFLFPPTRKIWSAGLIDHAPSDLHHITMQRWKHRVPTVALIAATPMDSHGYLRCSLSQMQEGELFDKCDRIIVEVNPNYPVVGGDTAFHISRVDCLVETNTPVPVLPRTEPGETDRTIGGYVSELINDGDTIQLGIGGIPDAAATALTGKKDLGVHTEMLTNSIATLVEKGVINGSRKTLRKGKIVATFAFGDQKLYDMMDGNPAVEILRGSYVNDPFVIQQNDNMVSVNSCIAVDLGGQICSESIGHVQYSGTGGASDFAFGSFRAKGGRAIVAVHSTAMDGEVSTITPCLPPGSVVSIRRNTVDYIVTEYGIAPLRGRTIRERADNLIAVAHPKFRDSLKAQTDKLGLH